MGNYDETLVLGSFTGWFHGRKNGVHMSHEISYDDGNHPMKEMMVMLIRIFHGMIMGQFSCNCNGKVTSSWISMHRFLHFRFFSMKLCRFRKTTMVSCKMINIGWFSISILHYVHLLEGLIDSLLLVPVMSWFGENMVRWSPHELQISRQDVWKLCPNWPFGDIWSLANVHTQFHSTILYLAKYRLVIYASVYPGPLLFPPSQLKLMDVYDKNGNRKNIEKYSISYVIWSIPTSLVTDHSTGLYRFSFHTHPAQMLHRATSQPWQSWYPVSFASFC
jgi:hypothetical protein